MGDHGQETGGKLLHRVRIFGATTNVFDGLRPDWGPFGALGDKGRMAIQVVMAAVLLLLIARALVGAGKMRVGRESHNSLAAEEGRKEVLSGLSGAFLVASMATIFTVVYGLGL
jgi:hypothetical protein